MMYIIKRNKKYLRVINGVYQMWTSNQNEATKFSLDEIFLITKNTLFEIIPL